MNRDMLNKNFKIEDRNFLLDIEKLTNKYINLKEIRDAYYDELSEFKNELDIEEIQSELNYLHLFLLASERHIYITNGLKNKFFTFFLAHIYIFLYLCEKFRCEKFRNN